MDHNQEPQKSKFCRFCYESNDKIDKLDTPVKKFSPMLIAPCLCKGSLKYIHQHCLKIWIKYSPQFLMKCQLCQSFYACKQYRRPLKEMVEKLIKTLRKYGLRLAKDLLILSIILSFLIGTIIYLYNYHKEKESYALNIVLTAFVSRMTGIEVIKTIQTRFLKIAYCIHSIIYKKDFVDHSRVVAPRKYLKNDSILGINNILNLQSSDDNDDHDKDEKEQMKMKKQIKKLKIANSTNEMFVKNEL